jgi:glycosyltransferase involved in cell wall biosynthesis
LERNPRLRIVIPAFNEADRIDPTIAQYCNHFGPRATVVVVTDGCTDDTNTVVRNAQRRYANLYLIELTHHVGKGGAIRIGLDSGTEEFVGYVDADGATSALEFERLYGIAEQKDVQGVIGSRWLKGARVEPRQPLRRRFASRAFNLIVRALFTLDFRDTQCGAKIFRRSALVSALDHLELCDFAADIEILWKLTRSGHDVLEVPTVWADRSIGTKVELFSAGWTMLRGVLYLRLRESTAANSMLLQALRSTSVRPLPAIPTDGLRDIAAAAVSVPQSTA